MQKSFTHIGIGEIIYTKRIRCKSIKVSISVNRGVRVSLPFYTPYSKAIEFVDANIAKIMAALEKQRAKIDSSSRYKPKHTTAELKEIRKRAHLVLPQKLEEISERLNRTVLIKNKLGIRKTNPFSYNRLAIKNNKTNWGSCSSAKNINLNMHLVNLPAELIDFVIIHELCHLVYPNHSAKFHDLVNQICSGKEKSLSAQLKLHYLQ